MRYQAHSRVEVSGYGPRAFWVMLIVFGIGCILFFLMKPPPFNDCKKIDSTLCACPRDAADFKTRNLIIIDTTDPLRQGKYEDIELLISTLSGKTKSFFDWVADGKRADKTSIFLLGSDAPADMRPIGTFCTMPPSIAMIASDFKGFELRQIESAQRSEIKRSVEMAVASSQAPRSPIIEALSIITGNASHWTPGGDLILVSDLLQNTNECGLFESSNRTPEFGSISKVCRSYVDNLQEHLRPTKSNKGPTVVALCMLPGKAPKDGVIAFWRELIQQGLSYDALITCDPKEIISRREIIEHRLGPEASRGSK